MNSFIATIAPIAVKLRQSGSPIFPSLRIAQAAHETGWIIHAWNNLVGYKVGSGKLTAYWGGQIVNKGTWEVYDGKRTDVNAAFRAYASIEDCFRDQDLLFDISRYDQVRTSTTPEDQAVALYRCGYATDPQYHVKLINMINQYGLKKYDQEVNADMFEKIRVSVDTVKQIPLTDYGTKGSDVRVVTLNPAEWEADFIVRPGKTVEQIAVAENADIAINGPFFWDGVITGYSRTKEKITSYDTEPKTYPWYGFAMKQGMPFIGPILGADVVDFAFKSGPLVVWDGKNVAKERMDLENTASDIRARKPRPVIYIDVNGIITIAVVDGWTRKNEYKYDSGLNPIELGNMGINLFKARKGLNLDGGGSTTLYIKGQGVVNALQEGVQRAVGHAIVFRRKLSIGYKDADVMTYGDLKKLGLVR